MKKVLIILCLVACSCGKYIDLSKVKGDVSSLENKHVTTKGIVTGVFQDSGQLGGFFLESSDFFSRNGIFVKSKQHVKFGDEILITGKVIEYKNETRLDSVQTIEVLSSDNKVIPQSVKLPISKENLENLEGCLIRIENELQISDTYSFFKYGKLLLSTSDLIQPTEIYDAQFDSIKIQKITNNKYVNSIVVDDLSNKRFIAVDSLYCDANSLVIGNTCSGLVGYLSQRNNEYSLRLKDDISINFKDRNESIELEGELKVMAFNLHNLFNGDGAGGGFPTSRGAKTGEEYLLQVRKLASAISYQNPDIIAIMEIENDGVDSLSSIVQFCEFLNKKNSNRNYAVSLSNSTPGNDHIKTGIIYDFNVISTSSKAQYYQNKIFSRSPLFQRFRYKNEEFVLSVNHFKSKSPRGAEGLDKDQNDGQASFNNKRTKQAETLLSIIDSLYSEDNLLVVGDFNAYTMEDPIQTLESKNLNRVDVNGYSYIYKGQQGNLDHAFVNSEFTETVKDAKVWDINASYPNWIDYRHSKADTTFYRSSDHNPLLIGLY